MSLFPPSRWPYWHHRLIRLQWRRWLLPMLFCFPYLLSLFWLWGQGLSWLVQIMLAPLVMTLIIAAVTWRLERLEFRTSRRRR